MGTSAAESMLEYDAVQHSVGARGGSKPEGRGLGFARGLTVDGGIKAKLVGGREQPPTSFATRQLSW